MLLYCGIGVLVYGTLLFSPSVLEKIWALVPQLDAGVPDALQQSPPVVVALLLTVLLSKVPALAALDDFVRTRLQHMAAIPYEVRRLAVELKRASFRPPARTSTRRSPPRSSPRGSRRPTPVRGRRHPPRALVRLATLMRRVEAWEAEGGLREYFIECPGDLETLRERYEEMGVKVRRAYGLAGTGGRDARRAGGGHAGGVP